MKVYICGSKKTKEKIMKSRKPILFLTIAFALVCIYHLSFTWKVNSIDEKKVEYAKTQLEKNKKDALLSISEEEIANESSAPAELPSTGVAFRSVVCE